MKKTLDKRQRKGKELDEVQISLLGINVMNEQMKLIDADKLKAEIQMNLIVIDKVQMLLKCVSK